MAAAPVPFIHPSAWVDSPRQIGPGCTIWHFCHVMAGAVLGPDCSLGQNVFVAGGVRLGARVKVQNNVSLYAGVVVGDDVFLGPGAVVTNVRQPRATRSQRGQYVTTHIGRGATLGAHVTVICGNHVGAHAFLAAGCVLTRPAPPFALMVGVPARRVGWVGHHGVRLVAAGAGQWRCPETGAMYGEIDGALQPAAAAPPPARAEAA